MYVMAPDGRAVYLTQPMWQSYSEISGKSPLDSPTYGGYPVGIDDYDSPDAVGIRLDNGGLVLGPREDTQLFWIPAQGVQRWTELGGLRGDLGFPSSNLKVSLDGAVIEFQRGALRVAAENVAPMYAGQTVPIELLVPSDPSDGLDIDAIRNRLIRQWGGTAWWVDDAGVRHWVPDTATWTCLGGEDVVFPGAHDLHGWTVWLFPLGAPATCADAVPTPTTEVGVSERVFERANHRTRSSAHRCTGEDVCRMATRCTDELAGLRHCHPRRRAPRHTRSRHPLRSGPEQRDPHRPRADPR